MIWDKNVFLFFLLFFVCAKGWLGNHLKYMQRLRLAINKKSTIPMTKTVCCRSIIIIIIECSYFDSHGYSSCQIYSEQISMNYSERIENFRTLFGRFHDNSSIAILKAKRQTELSWFDISLCTRLNNLSCLLLSKNLSFELGKVIIMKNFSLY